MSEDGSSGAGELGFFPASTRGLSEPGLPDLSRVRRSIDSALQGLAGDIDLPDFGGLFDDGDGHHVTKRAVESGDVWQVGEHRLYVTDHRVDDVQSAVSEFGPDCVFFDPPFQWTDVYGWVPDVGECDALVVCSDSWRLADAIHAATDKGWPYFGELVWDGLSSWFSQGRPLARHKVALLFGEIDWQFKDATYRDPKTYKHKHLSTVFPLANNGTENDFSHAKPLRWVRAMLSGIGPGRLWDPCAGSGTVMLAAQQIGVPSMGAELDPLAAGIILDRMESKCGIVPEKVGEVEARGAPDRNGDDDDRYERSRFYRSRQWRRLHKMALRRDDDTCVECGASPGRENLQVDHIVPRSEGGADLPSNLQTLCTGCHGRKTIS